jgi:hypothetical protein
MKAAAQVAGLREQALKVSPDSAPAIDFIAFSTVRALTDQIDGGGPS